MKLVRNILLWGLVAILVFSVVCLISFRRAETADSVSDAVMTVVQYSMERAYFEGQRDAATNDWRVGTNEMGEWVWLSCPWDGGTNTFYDPKVSQEEFYDGLPKARGE